MLDPLATFVRPLAGNLAGTAPGTDVSNAPPAAPPPPNAASVASTSPSGAGASSTGGFRASGPYVPPLARNGADGSGKGGETPGGAAAAYAEHGSGNAAGAGEGVDGGEWMSASVTQPNAPSFAEAAARLTNGHESAIPDDRRASLDYLVSSMKAAFTPAGSGDASAAMRHATTAYAEF